MTVESDLASLGELLAKAEAAFQGEKRSHEDTLEDLGYALDRANTAEQELRELSADVEASTAVDLLKRYRLVCAEKAVLVQQLATANALRGNQ